MRINKLPDEINSLILSFLVNDKPKSSLDLESYRNLSLVNKEFNKNVLKYQSIYKILKLDILNLKLKHKYLTEIVKYELKNKIEVVLPTNTNEGCLLCHNYIPEWWPKIYSSQNNIYPITLQKIEKWDKRTNHLIGEGICGHCNKNIILCRFCLDKFGYESLNYRMILNNLDLNCIGCSAFRKCKWCDKHIHPLRYGNKNDKFSDFCNINCYESEQDYYFFASMNTY